MYVHKTDYFLRRLRLYKRNNAEQKCVWVGLVTSQPPLPERYSRGSCVRSTFIHRLQAHALTPTTSTTTNRRCCCCCLAVAESRAVLLLFLLLPCHPHDSRPPHPTTIMSTTLAAPPRPPASPYLNNAVAIYPYTIDYTNEALLQEGLRAVAREIVPGWKDLGLDKEEADLTVTVISGGITNLLYRVSINPTHPALKNEGKSEVIRDAIVRIYGRNTEVIIDRERDNRLFAQLSTLGTCIFTPIHPPTHLLDTCMDQGLRPLTSAASRMGGWKGGWRPCH